MSKLYEPAFSDPHYGIIRPEGRKYTLAGGPGTPTALTLPAAGYEKGCIFQNFSGSLGSLVYVNTGSVTVAAWTNIV